MNRLIYDIESPKHETYSELVPCCHPHCQEYAINSHLAQRNRFLTRIAENGKVLQLCDEQLQSNIDSGIPYKILDIKDALSLPVFCSNHDGKLFRRIEQVEPNLSDMDTLLLLSYRAECGVYMQEQRRRIFYDKNLISNPFCQGPLFEERKKHSDAVLNMIAEDIETIRTDRKNGCYENYMFASYDIRDVPICLSDVVFLESELIAKRNGEQSNLNPLYIHVLPQDFGLSKVVLGYRRGAISTLIRTILERWSAEDSTSKRILELLAISNNWCCSPSWFGEQRDAVCDWLQEKKIQFQFENRLPFD